MKLTVIIPVYGVEATLDRCVESVLRQDVPDMEVILVDDGSPDRCPQMCDDWKARDARICVIHKENGGLSDARNAALDIAKGDYITFVDADDWISPDTYKPLLERMGDSDLLEYSIAGRLSLHDTTYHHASDYWLQSRAYTHAYAWNKIYRRSLFSHIRFPKGRVFEDVSTLPLLLQQTRQITTTRLGFYHYWFNPNGITATADGSQLAQLLDAHLSSGMPIDDEYYMYLLNIQIDVWEQTGAPVILERRKVSIRALSGRTKLKAIFNNILAINRLCKISKFIHTFKKPTRW